MGNNASLDSQEYRKSESQPEKSPGAKKRFLRVLLSVPVILIGGVLGLSYMKSHSQPYSQEIDESLIPMFSPANLDFVHQHSGESLPMIASCIIDIDGDRVPEVFLGGGRDQADALYRYSVSGFAAVKSCAGISKDLPDASYGAATIDVDNDGDSDLFVTRDSGVTLYVNDNGTFAGKLLQIPFDHQSTPLSLAFADLNRDGAVDMFVSTYLPKAQMGGVKIFNRGGYGSSSLLLLNDGDNTFTDITAESGMACAHNTFQGVFVDLDGDHQQDLVVACDTGHVKTWKNMGNLQFRDMPNPTTNVYGYPMGIAVADYNNDGRVDFFFSNTGGTAPRFPAKGDLTEDQVFDDRLIFLRNNGGFTFSNINQETQTADYELSWGAVFHDLNLDGRQDLIISQNFIDFPSHRIFKLPGRVLIQRPDGTFAATEDRSGVVNRHYEITSLMADFNQDGYPDMVRVNLAGPAVAFINNGGDRHYLKVRLPDNASTMGARVTVTTAGGKTYHDWLVTGEGLVCDQSHVLTFGLGDEAECTHIEILYPDGGIHTIVRPAVDTLVEIDPSRPAASIDARAVGGA